MQIYVDADACPVTDIVEAIAEKHKIPVTLLCDTNLMYIAFLFPLFLLWVFCLLVAIISTVGILYIRKHS